MQQPDNVIAMNAQQQSWQRQVQGTRLEEMLSRGPSASLAEWASFVFAEMAELYGGKLAMQWPDGIAGGKRKLEEGLQGYRRSDIVRGLIALNHTPWPPTVPEFLLLCRPQISFETAYYEACQQMALRRTGRDHWSHPAVYWAAVRYGASDLQHHSWIQARARWTTLLMQALNEQLDDVPKAGIKQLAAPGKTVTDAEVARRQLAKLRALCKIAASKREDV